MPLPLISEYIQAIKSAEENFDELKNLRPMLGEDGEPIFSNGNFAVVFKMKDGQTGKLYAVKCFTKECLLKHRIVMKTNFPCYLWIGLKGLLLTFL